MWITPQTEQMPATWLDRPRYPVAVGSAREFVRDAADVLVVAARLLLRHWPVLVALGLAGMAFRGAALWAAVEVSDHVKRLGHGLVILAPLGFLVAMTAMLHSRAATRAPTFVAGLDISHREKTPRARTEVSIKTFPRSQPRGLPRLDP
jgi:hypothetical protein